MTVTVSTANPLRRGLYGVFAGALLLVTPAAVLPVANAAPQQCDPTVGESVDSYLQRHPDIKADLDSRAQAESPGAPNPVLDYLERHPDVRQALITLSQQCVP